MLSRNCGHRVAIGERWTGVNAQCERFTCRVTTPIIIIIARIHERKHFNYCIKLKFEMEHGKNATNDHHSHTEYIKSRRNRRGKQQRRVKLRRIKATKTQVARVHTSENSRKKTTTATTSAQCMCSCILCWCKFIGISKMRLDFSFCRFLFFLSFRWCLFCFAALCFRLPHCCTVFGDEHHFWRIYNAIRNGGMPLLLLACLCACVMLLRFCAIFFKWNVSIFIGDFIIIEYSFFLYRCWLVWSTVKSVCVDGCAYFYVHSVFFFTFLAKNFTPWQRPLVFIIIFKPI